MAVTIELDVFSGRPDPRWVLGADDERALRGRLSALAGPAPAPRDAGLGYRGMVVSIDGRRLRVFEGAVRGEAAGESWRDPGRGLERWLSSTGKGSVDEGLLEGIRREIG